MMGVEDSNGLVTPTPILMVGPMVRVEVRVLPLEGVKAEILASEPAPVSRALLHRVAVLGALVAATERMAARV